LLFPWLVLPGLAALGERWPWLKHRSAPSLAKTAVAVLLVLLLLFTVPALGLLTGQPRSAAVALRPDIPWAVGFQLRSRVGENAPTPPKAEPGPPLLLGLARRLRTTYPDERFTGAVLGSEYASDVLRFLLPEKTPVLLSSRVLLFSPEHWRV